MYISITSNKKNLLTYLKLRSYFHMELYRTVILKPRTPKEFNEIEVFSSRHNLTMDIHENGEEYIINNMKYEYAMNYRISDSDINKFREKLYKTIRSIDIDESFKITSIDIETFNSMLLKLKMKLQSKVSVTNSKYYFDYVIMPIVNKFLKQASK